MDAMKFEPMWEEYATTEWEYASHNEFDGGEKGNSIQRLDFGRHDAADSCMKKYCLATTCCSMPDISWRGIAPIITSRGTHDTAMDLRGTHDTAMDLKRWDGVATIYPLTGNARSHVHCF